MKRYYLAYIVDKLNPYGIPYTINHRYRCKILDNHGKINGKISFFVSILGKDYRSSVAIDNLAQKVAREFPFEEGDSVVEDKFSHRSHDEMNLSYFKKRLIRHSISPATLDESHGEGKK